MSRSYVFEVMKKNTPFNNIDLNIKAVKPVKITESRLLKINSKSWSIITEFYIESVKINCYKPGNVTSAAVIKIGDVSGTVTGVIKGSAIGALFDLSYEEWQKIESLCACQQQLFYRYFKDGLTRNFRCEQKLFYEFCNTNQTQEILAAIYARCPNLRSKDKDDAVVQIFDLYKANNHILDLYKENFRI